MSCDNRPRRNAFESALILAICIAAIVWVVIAKTPKHGQRWEIQEVHAQAHAELLQTPAPTPSPIIHMVEKGDDNGNASQWALYQIGNSSMYIFCKDGYQAWSCLQFSY